MDRESDFPSLYWSEHPLSSLLYGSLHGASQHWSLLPVFEEYNRERELDKKVYTKRDRERKIEGANRKNPVGKK